MLKIAENKNYSVHSDAQQTMLDVRGVSLSFGSSKGTVLQNISLKVAASELVAVIGPSGCGKSTLLNIIAGILMPDMGSVTVSANEQSSSSVNVGYMQQKDLLLPWRTALSNACLSLEVRGISKDEAKSRVHSLADTFGVSEVMNRYPWQLSGGMRQRIALLRATVTCPNLLLLDEPFSALDAITRNKLHTWLMGILKEKQMATILVTHDVEEALLLADRVLVMQTSPGEIIAEIEIDFNRENTTGIHSGRFFEIKNRVVQLLSEGV